MATLSANPQAHAGPTSATAGAPLAVAITRAASAQTYATIRLLADRDRAADAFRAYAYFRWLDDRIDDAPGDAAEKTALLGRQRAIMEAARRGAAPDDLCPEETLLAEMVAADPEPNSGLQTYLDNMMGVLAFDVARRGRLVSAAALEGYTRLLAAGVTEALLHFIGHGSGSREQPPPPDETRHLAVMGACVVHMLRDAVEDAAAGYYNIPAGYLAGNGIGPADVDDPAYRVWVAARVALARDCFRRGRIWLAGLDCARRRLAGRAYIARFEWVAGQIERDGYRLRPSYPERKSARAAAWMGWRTINN